MELARVFLEQDRFQDNEIPPNWNSCSRCELQIKNGNEFGIQLHSEDFYGITEANELYCHCESFNVLCDFKDWKQQVRDSHSQSTRNCKFEFHATEIKNTTDEKFHGSERLLNYAGNVNSFETLWLYNNKEQKFEISSTTEKNPLECDTNDFQNKNEQILELVDDWTVLDLDTNRYVTNRVDSARKKGNIRPDIHEFTSKFNNYANNYHPHLEKNKINTEHDKFGKENPKRAESKIEIPVTNECEYTNLLCQKETKETCRTNSVKSRTERLNKKACKKRVTHIDGSGRNLREEKVRVKKNRGFERRSIASRFDNSELKRIKSETKSNNKEAEPSVTLARKCKRKAKSNYRSSTFTAHDSLDLLQRAMKRNHSGLPKKVPFLKKCQPIFKIQSGNCIVTKVKGQIPEKFSLSPVTKPDPQQMVTRLKGLAMQENGLDILNTAPRSIALLDEDLQQTKIRNYSYPPKTTPLHKKGQPIFKTQSGNCKVTEMKQQNQEKSLPSLVTVPHPQQVAIRPNALPDRDVVIESFSETSVRPVRFLNSEFKRTNSETKSNDKIDEPKVTIAGDFPSTSAEREERSNSGSSTFTAHTDLQRTKIRNYSYPPKTTPLHKKGQPIFKTQSGNCEVTTMTHPQQVAIRPIALLDGDVVIESFSETSVQPVRFVNSEFKRTKSETKSNDKKDKPKVTVAGGFPSISAEREERSNSASSTFTAHDNIDLLQRTTRWQLGRPKTTPLHKKRQPILKTLSGNCIVTKVKQQISEKSSPLPVTKPHPQQMEIKVKGLDAGLVMQVNGLNILNTVPPRPIALPGGDVVIESFSETFVRLLAEKFKS